MTEQDDFEAGRRSSLARGAGTQPSALPKTRARAGGRPRLWLALQVLTAAALVVLAVGLAVVLRSLRPSNALVPAASTPVASPSASVAPSENPTAPPSPVVGSGAPYPLLPPSTLRMIDATTGWAGRLRAEHRLAGRDAADVPLRDPRRRRLLAARSADAPQVFTPSFVDAQHGFALNGKTNQILFTGDGGGHWTVRGTIPSTQGVMDLEFVDASTGWALGSEPAGETILETADGGQTWTRQFGP